MKATRLLTLLLACMLVTSLFSGCGEAKETEQSGEPAETAVSAPETEAPDQTKAPAEEEPVPLYPLAEPAYLTIWSVASADMYNVIGSTSNHSVYLAAEEATNIHVEWIDVGMANAAEQFSVMAASGEYTDIIKCFVNQYNTNGLSGAYAEDLIIDLTAYLPEYAPDYYEIVTSDEAIWRDVTDVSGKALGFYIIRNEALIDNSLAVRQDLLDELGLEKPVTYEDFTDVLTAFQTEYGMKNAYFYTLPWTGLNANSGNNISGGYGAQMGFMQIDGEVLYGPLQDGYRSYLALLHSWYAAGLLNNDFMSYETNPLSPSNSAIILSNDAGIFTASTENITSFVAQNTTGRDDYRLVALGDPVAADGDGMNHLSVATSAVNTMSHTATVTTACEDIPSACLFVNYFFTEEGAFSANYGFEDVTYTVDAAGKKVFTDLLIHNPDGLSYGVARQVYLFFTQFPNYYDVRNNFGTFNEDSYAANDIWKERNDNLYLLPTSMSVLSEDAGDFNAIMGDIYTLNEEMWMRFISGEVELTDENWESYKQNLLSLNIEAAVGYYQEAYDLFMSK